MIAIGKKIKEARVAAGLTQSELAQGIVTRNQIGLIEKDINSPSLKTLAMISDRLNLSISYFLSEEIFNESEFVRLRNRIEMDISKKNFIRADEAINELIGLADKDSKLQFAFIQFYKGLVYYYKNDCTNAVKALEDCINNISIIYENVYYKAYAFLSFSLFKLQMYDRCFSCIEKCEVYFDNKLLENLVVYSTIKRCKAEYYIRNFRYIECLTICEEYIELCRIHKLSYKIGVFLMLSSACYIRTKKLVQAENTCMYAHQYFGFLKDNLNKYLTLGNLGAIRFLKGDFQSAKKLFKLVLIKGPGEGALEENVVQSEIHLKKCDVMLGVINKNELKSLVSRFKGNLFSDYGVNLDLIILEAYAEYLDSNYKVAYEQLKNIEEDIIKLNIEFADFYWALRSTIANSLENYKEAFEALRNVSNLSFNIFK